jgi:predicted ArsR family transcriptional regulator
LRRLGPPPGFESLADLAPLVERAAQRARKLAQDDTDDPILGALRERGSATTAELAAALDQPASDVRVALRTLVADGLVSRSGHAKTTRYHA